MAETTQYNIAVIHSRLRCIDGVSIEGEKWVKAYQSLGNNVFLIAGRIGERTNLKKLVIPELDFTNSFIRVLKKMAFESDLDKHSKSSLNSLINLLAKKIKKKILSFIKKNNINILSIENALSIPLNLPLGVALKEIIQETNMPVIARHHDFYWEREYFTKKNNVPKILQSCFPPSSKNIVHVTISEIAAKSLKEKKGIDAFPIPNTIDFSSLSVKDEYNKDLRKDFGIKEDQFIFLQPTRITKRKSIERSVELVAKINALTKKENVLIITGPPLYGDSHYFTKVISLAKELRVSVILAPDRVGLKRKQTANKKIYSIDDMYAHADAITFPSDIEGFGNPVLEACAYKKPLFVNNFPVFKEINKKNFDFVLIDQKVTDETAKKMYDVLTDENKRKEMVDKNYDIALANFSQKSLQDTLSKIIVKKEEPVKECGSSSQDTEKPKTT